MQNTLQQKTGNRAIILIAGMVIQLCAGIIYMWSVFRGPIAERLSWDLDKATLTSSIMMACFVLGILGGGRVQDKTGPKIACIIGSLLMSIGIVLTGLVTPAAPWLVYITYGIMGGLGVGTVYTSTVAAIQKWYPDKRGFATGMTVCAFGFSLVLFAPVANSMISAMGISTTFFIFGGGFFVLCVVCSLLMKNPPEGYTPAGFVKKAAAPVTAKQYTPLEMLKTMDFYLIMLSMLLVLPAYFILNPLLMTLGAERGLPESLSVVAVMITGIASATGRLAFSWLSDKSGRKIALCLICLVTIASVLCTIVAQGVFFLVCIALIAFAFGGSSGVYSAVTADRFGTKNVGTNFGLVMFGFGISAIVFPMISNALSAGGSYTMSFVLAAVTSVVSLILILLLKDPSGKKLGKK